MRDGVRRARLGQRETAQRLFLRGEGRRSVAEDYTEEEEEGTDVVVLEHAVRAYELLVHDLEDLLVVQELRSLVLEGVEFRVGAVRGLGAGSLSQSGWRKEGRTHSAATAASLSRSLLVPTLLMTWVSGMRWRVESCEELRRRTCSMLHMISRWTHSSRLCIRSTCCCLFSDCRVATRRNQHPPRLQHREGERERENAD